MPPLLQVLEKPVDHSPRSLELHRVEEFSLFMISSYPTHRFLAQRQNLRDVPYSLLKPADPDKEPEASPAADSSDL